MSGSPDGATAAESPGSSRSVPSVDPAVRPTEYRQHRWVAPRDAAELLLVRHGASAPAVDGESFPLVDGHGDPPLAPEGHQQAELLAGRLVAEDIHAIYVTNLRRTAQTAQPLAARLGLLPEVEPDLREVYLGEWEGGSFRKHVSEGHPIALQMWEQERWDVIPGAEPHDEFIERVRRGIVTIASRHRGERVVVVTHGGVIAAIVAEATGSRRFAFAGPDNTSVHHLVIHGDRWMIRSYNDITHLGPYTPGPNTPGPNTPGL